MSSPSCAGSATSRRGRRTSCGGVALVERLDKAREEDQSYPFRVAAFQAIDHTLRFLEWTGGAEERQALVGLLPRLKDRAAVCTRVEWTIQKLDPETIVERGACNLRGEAEP